MPRYFFHVQDGTHRFDRKGIELSKASDAHARAMLVASTMLTGDPQLMPQTGWRLRVTDATGATICDLNFATGQEETLPALGDARAAEAEVAPPLEAVLQAN